MPNRISSRKQDSDKVQGEGSWVEMTGLKVKEMKAQRVEAEAERAKLKIYQKKLKKHKKAQEADPNLEDMDEYKTDYSPLESGIASLKKHILDWNWVNDDGEALPSPKDNPDVFDELTDTEVTFLINQMMGVDEVKN